MAARSLELYLHIPFCVRKCAYCDFLSAPAEETLRERYVRALIREIETVPEAREEYRVETVFLGGGTPSVLTGEQVGRILDALRARFVLAPEAEVSMEVNPGTAEAEKLKQYRAAGVNRLSIGLQSTVDEELRLLGRIHDYQTFLETYRLAREAGFDNINIDLMNSLPGQTPESWEQSLSRVIALGPEHISAYSLIIEEGTPFYERYGEDDRRRENGEVPRWLPTEEQERAMYRQTGELLRKAGYERYEISNYAKAGRACRHNEGYWTGVEYLGLGLGAASYINGVRFSNTRELKNYVAAWEAWASKDDGAFAFPATLREDVCELPPEERREEFFFLGLRRMAGVSRADYRERFGEDWTAYEERIGRLVEQGLLSRTEAGICLTEAGIDVSNYVFAELLA